MLAAVPARDACLLIETGPDGEDETRLVLEIDRPLVGAELRRLYEAAAPLRPNLNRMDVFPRNEMGKVDRIEMRRRLDRSAKARETAPA